MIYQTKGDIYESLFKDNKLQISKYLCSIFDKNNVARGCDEGNFIGRLTSAVNRRMTLQRTSTTRTLVEKNKVHSFNLSNVCSRVWLL